MVGVREQTRKQLEGILFIAPMCGVCEHNYWYVLNTAHWTDIHSPADTGRVSNNVVIGSHGNVWDVARKGFTLLLTGAAK